MATLHEILKTALGSCAKAKQRQWQLRLLFDMCPSSEVIAEQLPSALSTIVRFMCHFS